MFKEEEFSAINCEITACNENSYGGRPSSIQDAEGNEFRLISLEAGGWGNVGKFCFTLSQKHHSNFTSTLTIFITTCSNADAVKIGGKFMLTPQEVLCKRYVKVPLMEMHGYADRLAPLGSGNPYTFAPEEREGYISIL